MSDTILEYADRLFGDREAEAFPLLCRVDSPFDLKKMAVSDLPQLAREIRHFIIQALSRTGGHLGSSLGTVELAIALHYVFDFLKDRVVWDVGHQAYAHKILTGRRHHFDRLRQYGGISGFLKMAESSYDHFGAGHASTSISAVLGMAIARDLARDDHQVIAIIGDGAMTGGMAFEGLNQLGYLKRKMMVILNDNEMSISPNVGALSGYLNQMISGQLFQRMRGRMEKSVKAIPGIGETLAKKAHQLEHLLKTLLVPGFLFQELGFHYVGPVNGHNIDQLIRTFEQYKHFDGPLLVHVRTIKGKGFRLAEKKSETYHGVNVGYLASSQSSQATATQKNASPANPSFTKVFSQTMLRLAPRYPRMIGITAAMPSGTGLDQFAARFPERFFDVGIAEQHAVTFAAGMATRGFKPVVAVYSTFLQRAYDQVSHDVCLQHLDVTFCIDRGGLVGADGPTHHGVFDIAYLRSIPNIVLMAPMDANELQHMLATAVAYSGPVAVRYPRGKGVAVALDDDPKPIPIGRAECLRRGDDLLMVGYGPLLHHLLRAAEHLSIEDGIEASVINARFVKPLDLPLIQSMLPTTKNVLTLEDGCLQGGFGSALLEAFSDADIDGVKMVRLGIGDQFVAHGDVSTLYQLEEMDVPSVRARARALVRGTH